MKRIKKFVNKTKQHTSNDSNRILKMDYNRDLFCQGKIKEMGSNIIISPICNLILMELGTSCNF